MTNQLTLRSTDIPHLQLQRFGVGFDRMFDRIEEIMRANNRDNTNYPPYNVIRHTDDRYSIEIAVAGFKEGDIEIQVEDSQLKIEGRHAAPVEDGREYVHRGISSRDFTRVFTLAEHVEVIGAAQVDGILTVDLERQVPEEKRPKKVAITYVK